MPYLGKSPSFGVRQRYQYTATASQTTFSGTDTANLTLNYTDNNFVDVYQNGVLLKGGATDYTATSGTSVVLATGATADDVIEIIVYDAFSVGNFYSRTDSDSRYVNVDGDSMTGNLELKADSATLKFGADSEVILRHSADTGLSLEGSGLNTNFTINAFHATDATTPDLDLHKSGSSTIGTQAATADGEALGQIRFSGVDTSGDSRTGATISAAQVGTASSTVTANLTIDAAGDINLDADGGDIIFKDAGTSIGRLINSSTDFVIQSDAQDKDIIFKGDDGGSTIEAARIDMSAGGVFMVGTTSTEGGTDGGSTSGIALDGSSGIFLITRQNAPAVIVNRRGSDGDHMQFRKDGSNKGKIGSNVDRFEFFNAIDSNKVGLSFHDRIAPMKNGSATDNNVNLGDPSLRFSEFFCGNSTINTSDQNEKQDIESFTDTEMKVAKKISALFKKYKFKDAVSVKKDDARTHSGVIAQEVQTAFKEEGLDASKYAFWCSDTWWEETEKYTDDDGVEKTRRNTYSTKEKAPSGATEVTRLGIRYTELISFICAYNEQRFASIEARIKKLEDG